MWQNPSADQTSCLFLAFWFAPGSNHLLDGAFRWCNLRQKFTNPSLLALCLVQEFLMASSRFWLSLRANRSPIQNGICSLDTVSLAWRGRFPKLLHPERLWTFEFKNIKLLLMFQKTMPKLYGYMCMHVHTETYTVSELKLVGFSNKLTLGSWLVKIV